MTDTFDARYDRYLAAITRYAEADRAAQRAVERLRAANERGQASAASRRDAALERMARLDRDIDRRRDDVRRALDPLHTAHLLTDPPPVPSAVGAPTDTALAEAFARLRAATDQVARCAAAVRDAPPAAVSRSPSGWWAVAVAAVVIALVFVGGLLASRV